MWISRPELRGRANRPRRAAGPLSAWIAALGLSLGVGLGCAASHAPSRSRYSPSLATVGKVPAEAPAEAATRRALASGDEAAWQTLVLRLLAQAEDPAVRAEGLALAAGQEEELFRRLLDQAAKQSGPAEAVLRASAYAVGRHAPPVASEHLLELIAHRECCLQRSHLAAALEGLRLARVESGQTQRVTPETRRLLEGLSRHADPALASAAAELLPWIEADPR